MEKPKYIIICKKTAKYSNDVYESMPLTLEEAIKSYSDILAKGERYQDKKGNKKINRNPKSIRSLVSNINKAKNNSFEGGYSGLIYTYKKD